MNCFCLDIATITDVYLVPVHIEKHCGWTKQIYLGGIDRLDCKRERCGKQKNNILMSKGTF